MKIKKIVSWFVREVMFLVTYVLNHLLDFLAEGREVINPTQRLQKLAYRFVYLVGVSTILFWISMAVIASCEVVRDEWDYAKDYVAGKLSKKIVIVPEIVEVEVEKLEPELSKGDIESIIREVAEEKGFDVEPLLAIVTCEGGWNINALNPTNNSFDRGLYQWSRKYHPEISDECAKDVRCSTEKTIEHIQAKGYGAWKASAKCRSNYLR